MKPAEKKYLRDFGLSMVFYLITLGGSVLYVNTHDLAPWAQAALVLTPVIPCLFACHAVLVFSRTWDELQKAQALEGVLIAFLLVGFGTFAYGFLEGVGFPKLDTIWILPILVGAQGVAKIFVARRYQ